MTTAIPPGICPEVAAERGYLHVTRLAQLAAHEHRFLERQQQLPALLIPQYRLGQTPIHAWSLRPDDPRIDNSGKDVKYEHPAGVPLCLDILPRYRDALSDTTVPIWMTEGAKKADALASHLGAAIVPININGVWGWMRKEHGNGASHPLDDLDQIAWAGRPVVLAFDSDVTRKPEVQRALKALARHLTGRGAAVRVLVLPQDGEQKIGVDDALAAGMTPAVLQAYVRDLDDLPIPAAIEIEPAVLPRGPIVPPLPGYAAVDDALATTASPWLDAYIAFSRRWSPQSYDDFHEAVALWLLSTVAARRVVADYGGEQYSNLYIALCARTSLYAKSTVAAIARQVLEAAGLTFLLAPDDATPQAFLRSLTLRVPEGFGGLNEERQQAIRLKLACAAQKGWFYEEFGQKLHAMMQNSGTMVDFRGHLRRFDDCPPTYEYVTVSRGTDLIEQPYLALLANLTPADLRPHARRGSALWGDGFLARFALVAPPAELEMALIDFPEGVRFAPAAIVQPLRAWHERLGMPGVSIEERTNEKGGGIGFYDVTLGAYQPQRCIFGEGVWAAVSVYRKALYELLQHAGDDTDLDGNYARLHIKALRVAMLLASLENGGRIELRHWARAQQIAERWRANLHHLVAQLADGEPSRERAAEDRIMAFLHRHAEWVTPRIVAPYVKGLSTAEIKNYLERLHQAGVVETRTTTQTTWYRALPVQRCRRAEGAEVQKEPENVCTSSPAPSPEAETAQFDKGAEEKSPFSAPLTPLHLLTPSGHTEAAASSNGHTPKAETDFDHDKRRQAEVDRFLAEGQIKKAKAAAARIRGRKERERAEEQIDAYAAGVAV